MEFRTSIEVKPSSNISISHSSRILTLGSCFANAIGVKLQKGKFKAAVNPCGVIFNPLSIFKLLHSATEKENTFRNSYIQNQSIWYNFDFHSNFSSSHKEELESKIDDTIATLHTTLQQTDIITLTFGTSFVYKLNLTGEVVANCHKVPAFNFDKSLLSVHDIVKGFEKLHMAVKYLNPNIKFILTVSPVRHIKDGIELNSVSKSILRVACHEILSSYQDVEYFPAYEMVMDDLRDYRFYKSDMIHPSEVAEDYIWEKFQDRFIPTESRKILKEWESVVRAIHHKPFHPESEAHQKFLKETIHKMEELSKVLDVQEELNLLHQRLI
jgi:hypothetical protein